MNKSNLTMRQKYYIYIYTYIVWKIGNLINYSKWIKMIDKRVATGFDHLKNCNIIGIKVIYSLRSDTEKWKEINNKL